MKIVFHFTGNEPQTSGTGHPYAQSPTEPPRWKGFYADILITDSSQASDDGTRPFFAGDSIYIEGDGDAIKKALAMGLRALDGIEQVCRKRFADETEDIRQCPTCQCWVEFNETGRPVPHRNLNGIYDQEKGYPACESIWAGD